MQATRVGLSGLAVLVAVAPATQAFGQEAGQVAEGDVQKRLGAMAMALREAVSPDERQIENAAREMAAVGEAGDDALLDLMTDPVPAVRRAAVQALGARAPKSAMPAFIQALGDEEAGVVVDAVKVVATYQGEWPTRALVRWLAHDDKAVRGAIVAALEQRPVEDVREIVRKQLASPPVDSGPGPFLTALGRFPDRNAARDLVGALSDPELASYAMRGLTFFGDKAAPELLRWIEREGPKQEATAVAAVGVLAGFGDKARAGLGKLVEKGPLAIKRAALQGLLSQLGAEGAAKVDALAKHRSADVRVAVLEVLPTLEGANTRAAIEANLRHAHGPLRLLAIAAAGGGPASGLQSLLVQRYRELSARRTADTAEERRALLRALGRVGDAGAVSELIQAMGRDDESAAAIEALGLLGDQATGPLLFVIKSGDPVRTPLAVDALSRAGDSALEPMLQLLVHPSRDVRNIARQALAQAADPVIVPGVVKLVQEPETPGRAALIALLGHVPSDESAKALQTFATGPYDHEMRLAAVKALMRQDQAEVVPLLRKLAETDDSNDVRHLAVWALIGRGDVDSVPLLIKMLSYEKDFIRKTAALGLGYLAGVRDIAAISKKMSDPRSEIVSAVRDTLRRLSFHPEFKNPEEFTGWAQWFAKRPAAKLALKAGEMTLADGTVVAYWMGGQGKPLLVLHGGPDLDHGYLESGLAALGASHLLVFVDLPGRGASKLPPQGVPSLEHDVASVATTLARLNLFGVNVLGHGWGGLVAARLATKQPKLVSKLVLDGTPHPTLSGWAAELDAMAAAAPYPFKDDMQTFVSEAGNFLPEVRDRFIARLLMTGAVNKAHVLAQISGHLQTRPHLRTAYLNALGDFDLTGTLAKLDKPTLLLYGDALPMTEAGAAWRKELVKGNPNVVAKVIADAGYLPAYEQPKAYKDALDAFLK